MTNAELLFEFLMKIYSSNFALISKATVLNYPLPSHLIDIIQHKAFYIIIQQVTKTSQKAQRAQRLPDFTKKNSFRISTKLQLQNLDQTSGSKSKHIKGQLGPHVCHVTFLHQRRSVGAPRLSRHVFASKEVSQSLSMSPLLLFPLQGKPRYFG